MRILLLGKAQCPQLLRIKALIERQHNHCVIFDVTEYNESNRLSWWPQEERGLVHQGDEQLAYAGIDVIYWHGLPLPKLNAKHTTTDTPNLNYLLNTLYLYPTIHWVNPINTLKCRTTFAYNLCIARQLGAVIPFSYMGNDFEQAYAFIQGHSPLNIIPIHQLHGHHQTITAQCSPSRLQEYLLQGPIILQEQVSGRLIKSYVVGSLVLSAHLTYANDASVPTSIDAIELPPATENLSRRLCRGLGMRWCAITWCLTSEGSYLFINIDPAPDFILVEKSSGLPIADALADLLLDN
jgi:hypothetical protein